MKKSGPRWVLGIVLLGTGLLITGLVCSRAGARINTSRSIPVGLYWTSSKPAAKGDYVLFCPPPAPVFTEARERGYIAAGFCPGNYGYMMKRVLAIGDDSVSVTDAGVWVNDRLLPLSAPLKTDKAGRALPRSLASNLVLKGSEVLLMSDVSATSFDGRYFGPVERVQIRSVITPVFTW